MAIADGEMTGVRIRWPAGQDRSHSGSDFAVFFGTVLPHLRGLTWLVDTGSFRPPVDLPDDALAAFESRLRWVAAEGDGPLTGCVDPHYFAGPGFVPDYAAWADDDWNWMYGFDRQPADWRVWLRTAHQIGPRWQAERAAFLAATTAVCFFAVDYVCWEFFARDAGLVRATAEAAVAGGLLVEPAVLAESVGL
jgi:hypothetical protein